MQGLGLGATGAELVQLDVLDTASIDAAMAGVTAVVCATGFTPSFNIKKNNPAGPQHHSLASQFAFCRLCLS